MHLEGETFVYNVIYTYCKYIPFSNVCNSIRNKIKNLVIFYDELNQVNGSIFPPTHKPIFIYVPTLGRLVFV